MVTKGSHHHAQMAAMTSSGDITPPESRPEENKRSRRETNDLEVQSVESLAAGLSLCVRLKIFNLANEAYFESGVENSTEINRIKTEYPLRFSIR